MPLRPLKHWLIRGGILAVLAAAGYAGWWARAWVSPENVRAAVVTHLEHDFPGSQVRLDTARLRLLGGISVTDLALTRTGDPEPFFESPAGVIYHEKEQLNRGRLIVRKIEFDAPVIRLDRRADGTWNVAGALAETDPDTPVPTLLAHNATLHLHDHTANGFPAMIVRGAKVQLVNDPLPVLKLEASGTAVLGGDSPIETAVSVTARVNRVTKQSVVRLDLPEIRIGPPLAAAVAAARPDWADVLGRVSATVAVKAEFTYTPGGPTPVRSDVRLEVKNGRLEDPILPWPLEQVAGVVRVQDGRVTIEEKDKVTAVLGQARIELALETRDEPPRTTPPGAEPPADEGSAGLIQILEEKLQSLTVAVHNLPLTDEVFARLPDRTKKFRALFDPKGAIDLTYRFSRPAAGWRRDVDVKPNGLAVSYEKFRYPVADLSGTLRKTVAQDGTDEMTVQMTGKAGGRVIELRGRTAGSGEDPFIDLRVSGDDLPIDDVLFAALPKEKYRTALRKLGAHGRGNFAATIRQDLNCNLCESTFALTVTDGTMKYALFPYPLEQVRGEVYLSIITSTPTRPVRPGEPIRPLPDTDRYELKTLTARHGGGTLWLEGVNEVAENGRDRKLHLGLKGKNCPLDESFFKALESIRLTGVSRSFAPTGQLTFGIDAEVIDHIPPDPASPDPPFDPATDLKLTINFRGPTVTPDFFPYEFADLAGVVRYQGSVVDLVNVTARHGKSRWALDAGDVRFGPNGSVWANLGGVTASPIVPDATFLAAVPAGLRKGLADFNLRGSMDLAVRHLVVAVPPTPPPPTHAPEPVPISGTSAKLASPSPTKDPDPVVYWDAKLSFAGAAFDTGQPWADVRGTLGCVGRYEGAFLGPVSGTIWLDRATVADQPVSRVKASFAAEPQKPDPAKPGTYEPVAVRITDAAGTLFQGFIGGEARVVLSDPPRYRLWLTASDVRLDEIARHYKLGQDAELKGTAQARLVLENALDPKTGTLTLKGDGSVDVPAGRMYNLPVLLDLVKLAKFQAPDQTAFEEAHAAFRIQGDRVLVDHVDLIGSAVSLGGSGELDATGKYVKFDFYTVWSQTLKRWLTTPFGDVTAAVSDKLFRVEMTRGPDGVLKYEPRFVPMVTDPVRAIAERIRRRTAADPDPTARAAGK
jgi:hypothetical protein